MGREKYVAMAHDPKYTTSSDKHGRHEHVNGTESLGFTDDVTHWWKEQDEFSSV